MEYKSYETINGIVYYGSQSDAFENGDFIILTPSGVKDIASILESRKGSPTAEKSEKRR